MRKIRRREPAVRAARRLARRGARAVPLARREVQGRDHRIDPGRGRGLVLPARRLHRSLPRPARRARPATSRHSRCSSFAGAYWRGDERNPQLQRVYGTAFPSQAELDEHLHRLEEAKKRDHRDAGARAGSFSFDELVGPGFALWHPKGAMLRQLIEDLIRREVVRRGYQPVYSPARRARAAARDLRAPGALQREPVRRHGAGRAAVPRQADELPVPHRDLPVADAVVPRSAAPARRAGDGLPLRALGRAPRPLARAWLHAGRRAPLRARGADRGGDARTASSSPSTSSTCSASRT